MTQYKCVERPQTAVLKKSSFCALAPLRLSLAANIVNGAFFSVLSFGDTNSCLNFWVDLNATLIPYAP